MFCSLFESEEVRKFTANKLLHQDMFGYLNFGIFLLCLIMHNNLIVLEVFNVSYQPTNVELIKR